MTSDTAPANIDHHGATAGRKDRAMAHELAGIGQGLPPT
jgi:hypothetical protein